MIRAALLAVALVSAAPASATCYGEAAERYGLDPRLIRAIAIVESGERQAVATNANGSEDVCMMQINSWWMPRLGKRGITRERLLADPCLCVHVGAWILAQEVRRAGATWLAVGRYNSPTMRNQVIYANKVRRVFLRLSGRTEGPPHEDRIHRSAARPPGPQFGSD